MLKGDIKVLSNCVNKQVILITGASSGIGATLAKLLARTCSGICLVLAARRVEKLEFVATQCRKDGANVLVVPTDMTKTEEVKALASKALEHFKKVDVLVNNAGYGQLGPVELTSVKDIRNQLEVNLVSVLTLTKAIIPSMRDHGGGRIINISSVAGKIAFPFNGIYNASKFALEGVSDSLRIEVAPFNIYVSLIEPGAIKTEFFGLARQQIEQTLKRFPNNPYQKIMPKFNEVAKFYKKQAYLSDRVAEIIVRSINENKPKPRYIVAKNGRLLLFLLTIIPTCWLDRLQTKMYNLNLLKQKK